MRTSQEIFVENLKSIRKERKLSQLKLSELSGVSPGMIGDIETGKTNPTLGTIDKIIRALDVSAEDIFHDSLAEALTTEEKKLYNHRRDQDAMRTLVLKLIDELTGGDPYEQFKADTPDPPDEFGLWSDPPEK